MRSATAVAVTTSMAVAAAGFLPWRSTGRSRSGIELARTLHEVGLAPSGTRRFVLVLFLFTPMLAAGAWLAALAGRAQLVAILGGAIGVSGLASGASLRMSSLRTEVGVDIAMSAGILALAGAVVLMLRAKNSEGEW